MEPYDQLWNDDVTVNARYDNDKRSVQSAILDQYNSYVEMADRISQRRGLTNTFFLTINTAVFALIGVFLTSKAITGEPWWLLIPLIALLGQCFAWYYIVRSYRQLNTAKYRVIGALEERLPASPYWNAEWDLLGKGENAKKYWPLSHIEQWIPILFTALYLGGFIAAVVA